MLFFWSSLLMMRKARGVSIAGNQCRLFFFSFPLFILFSDLFLLPHFANFAPVPICFFSFRVQTKRHDVFAVFATVVDQRRFFSEFKQNVMVFLLFLPLLMTSSVTSARVNLCDGAAGCCGTGGHIPLALY